MKKALKWIGIVLGSLIGLLLLVGVVLYGMGISRFNKTYTIEPANLTLPTDEASLALGKHRAEVLCRGCHGEDLGGIYASKGRNRCDTAASAAPACS